MEITKLIINFLEERKEKYEGMGFVPTLKLLIDDLREETES